MVDSRSRSLCKHASELDLARVGGLPSDFALSVDRFFFDDRHSGSIHLDVKDGYRLTDDDGQIQLHGALDLLLLAGGDILSDRLRGALHTFCGSHRD